jgi:hypothetical protein
MTESAISLVPGKSESEIAAELVKRAVPHFEAIVKLMDEAVSSGLVLTWAGVQISPPFNRHKVIGLTVVKYLL